MPVRNKLSRYSFIKDADQFGGYCAEIPNSNWWFSGVNQSISSLNNTGVFIPGVFKANPVTIERWTCTGGEVDISYPVFYQGKYWPCRIRGNIGCYAIAQNSSFNWVIDQLRLEKTWEDNRAQMSYVKALSKLHEADFDLGIILGELRETYHGFKRPLSALSDYITKMQKAASLLGKIGWTLYCAYKRAKTPQQLQKVGRLVAQRLGGRDRTIKGALATLDALAGLWLEIRYGITPVMIAIDDLIKHVQSTEESLDGKVLRQSGKVTSEWRTSHNGYPSSPCNHSITGGYDLEIKKTYRTVFFYRLLRHRTKREKYGLTLDSLPGVLFELMLLSFVWDWFISISDWLGSHKDDGTREVLGSTTSCKTRIELTGNVRSLQRDYPVIVKIPINAQVDLLYECIERRVNMAKPVLPPVKLELISLERAIDALFLIWQRLPKLPRR